MTREEEVAQGRDAEAKGMIDRNTGRAVPLSPHPPPGNSGPQRRRSSGQGSMRSVNIGRSRASKSSELDRKRVSIGSGTTSNRFGGEGRKMLNVFLMQP